MTSEVAILNRYGIALAADSAVTIGEERVWKSTNKIFSLGPRNDIAIMMYGSGDFSGYPWEVVIKSFKRANAKHDFRTVEDCKLQFLEFLRDSRWVNPLQSQLCATSIFVKELSDLKDEATQDSATEFRKSTVSFLNEWTEIAKSYPLCVDNLSEKQFLNRFSKNIEKIRSEMFEQHFPKYLIKKINSYLYQYFIRSKCTTGYESGIVICGYGVAQNYPALSEIVVDGRCDDWLRAWDVRSPDLNSDPMQSAQIIPFAQRDMASLFMEGLSPTYLAYFFKLIQEILAKKSRDSIDLFQGTAEEKTVEQAIQNRTDKEILKRINKDFKDLRDNKFIQPLMSNVQSLPREEMAAMAESLVELTSLRRKFDSIVQTVAGPVDVAFISKTDGFIWMKRKHYFAKELNNEFFERKLFLEDPK